MFGTMVSRICHASSKGQNMDTVPKRIWCVVRVRRFETARNGNMFLVPRALGIGRRDPP